MVGTISLMAMSCAEKDSQEIIQSNNGNIAIRSVKFVDNDKVVDIDSEVKSDGSIRTQASVGTTKMAAVFGSEAAAPLAIQPGAEFDYISDVSSNAIAQQGGSLKASTKESGLKAGDIQLSKEKKFRLVFIKDGSSTPIYNEVLSAGQDPNLRVTANTKYQWYAISINDPNTAPNIDASGVIASSDLANKDFMFASGEITTKAEDNYLDILFLRQMAAIDLNINTRGLFGKINDNSTFSLAAGKVNALNNVVKTGSFSIFTGEFSNLEDVAPISASQMKAVDKPWGNAEKNVRVYTAYTNLTIEANNLRLRLNALNITLDDNTTRSFSANTIASIKHGTQLTLTKGTLSKTKVRLIESGVTVNGLVWARTNLVYDVNKLYGGSYSAGNSDAYRFRTNNNYAYPNINTEYWNFGTTTPRGTDYKTEDPCRRVYPEMTWRSPHENNPTELTRLSQNTNRVTSRLQVPDGYRHSMIWTGSQQSNPAYPDNNLVLSYAGYRDGNGNLQQNPSASSAGSGTLRFRSGSYDINNSAAKILFTEVRNGSFGGTSIQQTAFNSGTTIRCVRQINNN